MCVVFCVGLCVFGMKEVGKEKGRRERYIFTVCLCTVQYSVLSSFKTKNYAIC